MPRLGCGYEKPNETQTLPSETAAPKASETGRDIYKHYRHDKIEWGLQGGTCHLRVGEAKRTLRRGP